MRAREVIAYVALGSNLGDREEMLCFGVRSLADIAEITLVEASRLFETAPVGPPGQQHYLNAVVSLQPEIEPHELLRSLHAIERRAGRDRSREAIRFGPRTLDLDLLLYGDACIESPELELPHPRMHERAFVLTPLCDIAADVRHPRTGLQFSQLAESVADPDGVRVYASSAHWICGDLHSLSTDPAARAHAARPNPARK